MNALVVINDKNQDLSLGIVFDAEMNQRGWSSVEEVPSAYQKEVVPDSESDIAAIVKTDVDEAAFNAGWKDVPYLLVVSNKPATVEVAPGLHP